VDIPEMSITFNTLKTTNVEIIFSATIVIDDGWTMDVEPVVDGNETKAIGPFGFAANAPHFDSRCAQWIIKDISGGSHVIKMHARVTGGKGIIGFRSMTIRATYDEWQLHYDDGQVDAGWSTGPLAGAAVRFDNPFIALNLTKIKVAGWWEKEDAYFIIQIWDESLNTLFTAIYRGSNFFTEKLTWAEIDIPDLLIVGDFYVCVFPNSATNHIFWLGLDNTPQIDHHSYDVTSNPNDVGIEHSDWDWAIRAIGYQAIPKPSLMDFPDINGDGKVNIVDVYIIATKFGKQLQDP
jgi:hypothetical protein